MGRNTRQIREREAQRLAYEQAQAEKRTAALPAIEAAQKQGLKVNTVTLDRTTADIMSGKSTTPVSQLNPDQQMMIRTAMLNQKLYGGEITPDEYKRQTGQISQTFNKQQQKRTLDFAYSSSKAAKSEAIKQETARDVAATKGVAVGTIQKDNTAKTSSSSQVSTSNNVDSFVQSQKRPVQPSVTEQADNLTALGLSTLYNVDQNAPLSPDVGKRPTKESANVLQDTKTVYEVTDPKGKTRTFQTEENAEKFISRTQKGIPPNQEIIGFTSLTGDAIVKDDTRAYAGSLDYLTGKTTAKKFVPTLQNYPRSYDLKTDNPLDIVRGFWEGGVLPLAQLALIPKPIFSDILGPTKAEKESLKKSVKFVQDLIPAGPSASGAAVSQALTGKPITGTGEGIYYDIGSVGFDAATALIPAKKVPIPISIKSIKVPTPTGVRAVAKTVSLGFGEKTKVIAKTKLPTSIEIAPITAKETKRGVKLAADSSSESQQVLTSPEFVKSVKGITAKSIERADNINKIISIGSKSKDPVRTKSVEAFSFKDLTKQETPSTLKSFENQQKKIIGKLGPVEGSLSQNPFVIKDFIRPAGDFDFNVKNFGTASARARQTASDITPSPGRTFEARIKEPTKSAKVWVTQNEKSKKVGEFLSPEELDDSGVEQVIKGDSIFGKPIPKGTSKVDGLKVYNLQRQFVKKGESIFSLQRTGDVVELEPFGPRKTKDVSDFYAIGKTKEANLRESGRIKEADELGKELARFKRLFSEVDIDKFFKSKSPAKATFTTDRSLSQKLSSPSLSRGVSSSSASLISRGTSFSSRGSSPRSPASSRSLSRLTSRSSSSIPSRPSVSLVSKPSIPSIPKRQSVPSMLSRGKSTTLFSPKSTGSPGKSIGSLGGTGGKGGRTSGTRTGIFRTANTTQFNEKRKVLPAALRWKTAKSEGKERPSKARYNFLGSSSEYSIEGLYNRKEVTYGKKKIGLLRGQDKKKFSKKINLF